ncbi:MobP3 family relaxase [Ruminococcus sp. Marseille-P6503]|uniref:MobP3 family relaxase n=1 Tax=Ruminococcus sp. Marseille-P6503 TaxID=2364796 RepID=UPI001FAAC825|nr:MobP3 family relaxase [Ruminococcus sp. Marseille-P6503]
MVTSRYLKSGSGNRKQLYRYVKYIATREGSAPIPNTNEHAPAAKKQQELIFSLLKCFPDGKELFEYEDYQKNPTVKNASALISEILDRNMDRLTSRKNYVSYLANRPGAVKFGKHGLFSQSDEPVELEKTAKEIAAHGGNVWTHVVSLRRDSAQAMGYDNLKAWRDLVKRQIANIAKSQKIEMKNLRWYAAFHDKKTNPHVHIIVYSANEREGFLTNRGIEKIRSGFANDIYQDELHHLYQRQTDLRNLLKKESAEFMRKLVNDIAGNAFEDTELLSLVSKLSKQLNNVKGKKVYGYLKPEVKQTVNAIFARLAENDSIQKMYKLWCEMEQQKHDVYSSAKLQFPTLVDNKEFKSVKNMIVQTVLDMNSPVIDIEIEEPEPTEYFNEDTDNCISVNSALDDLMEYDFNRNVENAVTSDTGKTPKSKYYLKWSNEYKEACRIIYDKSSKPEDFKKAEQLLLSESNSGNILAIHDLGKLYSTDKLGEKDDEKSFSFYREALHAFTVIEPNADSMFPYEPRYEGQNMKSADMRSYVWYRIGKMHCYGLGTEQNYEKAFEWFLKSAQEGNKFAQYSLANLYYYGNGAERNLKEAFGWYMRSAKQGQPYASYAVAQMYSKGEYVEHDEKTAQKYYNQALSGFLKLEADGQADDNLFYKIGAMYKNGLGTEADMGMALEYFKRSAELNNKNGLYEYGKALLLGDKDMPKAMDCLEKAVRLGNLNAKRFLALEYISGEHIEQDIDKGIEMLTECADFSDPLSCFMLGRIYFNGEFVNRDLSKAEKYLLMADKDSGYACYYLGKLYQEEEKYDIDKAVEWLEKAVTYDDISAYASYSLAKILLEDNKYHDTQKAIKLLELSAEENNWASFLLGRLYLFGTEDIEKDKEKAMEWLNRSTDDGNVYAQTFLNQSGSFENTMLANTILSLFINLSRCIEDDYIRRYRSVRMSADKKLRRMIIEKKQALGIKEEQGYV